MIITPERRILLHVCCAPCGTYTVGRLRSQDFAVTGFWYNPNIHPWREHEERRESLVSYAQEIALPMLWHESYDMPTFLRMVVGNERFHQRCNFCYRLRLEKTAQKAAEEGISLITTTLLISPYQDQKMIRDIGEQVASEYGLSFHYEDFRQGWAERNRMTTSHRLYRQQYCGCIYSEWERYKPTQSGNPQERESK